MVLQLVKGVNMLSNLYHFQLHTDKGNLELGIFDQLVIGFKYSAVKMKAVFHSLDLLTPKNKSKISEAWKGKITFS